MPLRIGPVMDVYPIHHKNLIFNVITDIDLSFKEIRAILDYLLDNDAFKEPGREKAQVGKFYDFKIEKVQYVVDVNGYEVIVYRRTESS
jgi:hypothetical protein